MYELMGRAHAALVADHGQGTVEYVGLILLLAGLLAGVIAAGSKLADAGVASTLANKLKSTIENVGGK